MKNLVLKARIIERFGTQTDFARLLGMSEDRLSKLIHGRLKPREDERKTIARKLGAAPEELFQAL
jgi:transcriptional regulator with XRE-family HTH domain